MKKMMDCYEDYKEAWFISGITKAGLVKKHGLVEATHKYAEERK